jgi:hypothetical protein
MHRVNIVSACCLKMEVLCSSETSVKYRGITGIIRQKMKLFMTTGLLTLKQNCNIYSFTWIESCGHVASQVELLDNPVIKVPFISIFT